MEGEQKSGSGSIEELLISKDKNWPGRHGLESFLGVLYKDSESTKVRIHGKEFSVDQSKKFTQKKIAQIKKENPGANGNIWLTHNGQNIIMITWTVNQEGIEDFNARIKGKIFREGNESKVFDEQEKLYYTPRKVILESKEGSPIEKQQIAQEANEYGISAFPTQLTDTEINRKSLIFEQILPIICSQISSPQDLNTALLSFISQVVNIIYFFNNGPYLITDLKLENFVFENQKSSFKVKLIDIGSFAKENEPCIATFVDMNNPCRFSEEKLIIATNNLEAFGFIGTIASFLHSIHNKKPSPVLSFLNKNQEIRNRILSLLLTVKEVGCLFIDKEYSEILEKELREDKKIFFEFFIEKIKSVETKVSLQEIFIISGLEGVRQSSADDILAYFTNNLSPHDYQQKNAKENNHSARLGLVKDTAKKIYSEFEEFKKKSLYNNQSEEPARIGNLQLRI